MWPFRKMPHLTWLACGSVEETGDGEEKMFSIKTDEELLELQALHPRVDAGQLQKSVSRISGGIHARSGDSRTWSTNSVLHVLDASYHCFV